MVSTPVLKAKATSIGYVFTAEDLTEMIQFCWFIKSYARLALLLHNSCCKNTPKSEYQQKLFSSKEYAKRQSKLSFAKLAENAVLLKEYLQTENPTIIKLAVTFDSVLQSNAQHWKMQFELLSNQIVQDMQTAKMQYEHILKANDVFLGVFEILEANHELRSLASYGHSLDSQNHPILIIEFMGMQICCPQGFTKLNIDSDGFNTQLTHESIVTQDVECTSEIYDGVTSIEGFKPQIQTAVNQAVSKLSAYPKK